MIVCNSKHLNLKQLSDIRKAIYSDKRKLLTESYDTKLSIGLTEIIFSPVASVMSITLEIVSLANTFKQKLKDFNRVYIQLKKNNGYKNLTMEIKEELTNIYDNGKKRYYSMVTANITF